MRSRFAESNIPNLKRHLIECGCLHPSHLLVFEIDSWDDGKPDDISVYFAHNWKAPFWMRVKNAFKYLFLSEHLQYGDSVIIDERNIIDLKEVIEDIERGSQLNKHSTKKKCKD